MSIASIRSVSGDSIPDYPISADDRLDSHFFLQWNLKRWRGSSFRKRAYSDPEVGFFGFELFCLSQDETPIGTLPRDDCELAFILHLPLERWQALTARPLSPLHGWYEARCDTGEIRWAHPVVRDVALEALESKRRNAARNADERMRRRLKSIVVHLMDIPMAGKLASNDEMLNAISDWIEAAYPGGSATRKRVKEALTDLTRSR